MVAGFFNGTPKGVILHGSRSGNTMLTTHQEYVGTGNYAIDQPGGLGWHATIGDDEITIHMAPNEWGWNARSASSKYIGVEFAQPVERNAISDGQVRAFCWYFQQARQRYSKLPPYFPTHAELDGTQEYGGTYDGKTDVFTRGSLRTVELRVRIKDRLTALGVLQP